MKILIYEIEAIVEVPADNPGQITDVLEKIQEVGTAKIVGVSVREEMEPQDPEKN